MYYPQGHAMTSPGVSHFHGLSAPPPGFFGTVPGYEGTVGGSGGGYLPPPIPMQPITPPQPNQELPNWNIPVLSEDEARKAFKEYVSDKCCYSSGPAEEGVITNIEAFNTYRYRLETFTESRSTEWCYEPFTGQQVDAYMQPAPGPWVISVQPPLMFEDTTKVVKVPYTSSVKDCHDCQGKGNQPCKKCSGAGNKVCSICNGSGISSDEQRCSHCNSSGRENCSDCKGNGVKQCDVCKGKRQLLVYINLKVQWTNNKDDFVGEQSGGLELAKLSKVSGKELFKDAQYMVYPLMGFPDPNVNQASDRLIKEHWTKFSQAGRILQQRHTVDLIPVTRVIYKWKEACHTYFVYGNENKVSTNDYPATCCCTII